MILFMVQLMLLLVLSETLYTELSLPIFKCCRKGEELHSNGRDCVRRPGYQIQIMEDAENIDAGDPSQLQSQNHYWLSSSVLNKLPYQKLYVTYGKRDICYSEYFLLLNTDNIDRYAITDDYSLIVSFINVDGNTFNAEFMNGEYCLDSLSGPGRSHAFRLCTDEVNNVTTIRKCCKFGQRIELINSVVTCKDAENSTWSVQNSTFRSYLPNTTVTDIMDGSKNLCSTGEFKIVQPNEAYKFITESLDSLLDKYDTENYKCFDLFFDAFTENETIGFCHHTSKTLRAYLLVFRHFPVLAVVVLAIGLLILGNRSDIRKTIHGKALLCHILSLFILHVLYALWEYYIQLTNDDTILLALNFFIMSSALWLNAICFNMASGLGAPLQAHRKRNRWTVFAWYSLYVWGGSLLHTVLLATQPWREYEDRDIVSCVYHTRTFFYPDEWRNSLNLEALVFGYGPVCTLLIINICFLAIAILKIRKLERDTSLLYRRLSVRITNKKKSLKYVRLLLTTGVGETVVEIAALATRVPPTYDHETRLMDEEIWFTWMSSKEALFRILAMSCDLLRAFSVLALCCANDSGVLRSIRAGSRTLRRSVTACSGQNDTECATDMYTVNK